MIKLLLSLFFFTVSVSIGYTQVNPCLLGADFKIVILGSSTAAGSGPSSLDSAWVNKFEKYVQEINPNNEVVNLAVGGYNTYKIMPTGFTPPASRPNPDTIRNITKAIALNADAIIINMPSNDVSAGYSNSEQMFNLDTIHYISETANIPIWICTTQPRNFGNSSQLQQQWDIKDSIYAHFNPRVIDFWTTIATPTYTIEPAYDSGDGVHLNDVGHAILVSRVINASILDSIFSPEPYPDYSLFKQEIGLDSICGQVNTEFQYFFLNSGTDDTLGGTINFELYNTISSQLQTDFVNFQGLPSCTVDSLSFLGNTFSKGEYDITTFINSTDDLNNSNDTTYSSLLTSGHPMPIVLHDTLCYPNSGFLEVISEPTDTIFWYNSAASSSIIQTGPSYTTPIVGTTSDWFAQIVRGDLHFNQSLQTTLNSSIDWNGTMFDIVANQQIEIDSFGTKVSTTGTHAVEIFYKNGSHIGSELNSSAWTYLGIDTVLVSDSTILTNIHLGGLTINTGDTLGVHIRLANPASDLSYKWLSAPVQRSNSEIEIITGTGISYNFAASYYPRDWNGSVYYHFGNKPLGDCATEKLKATVYVSENQTPVNQDTIIDFNGQASLSAPGNMIAYNWSTGDSTQNIQVSGQDLGYGVHFVSFEYTDSLNCEKTDSIIVAVADLVGLEQENKFVKVYPNPTQDLIKINTIETVSDIALFAENGQRMKIISQDTTEIDISELPPGFYILQITTTSGMNSIKIAKY